MKRSWLKFRGVTFFLLLTHLAGTQLAARTSAIVAATNEPRVRHLIICVDGVAHTTIEEMRREGRFKLFRTPARMIAPFPSLTNLALAEILQPAGASESPGYEDNYFDTTQNKMRGGLLDRCGAPISNSKIRSRMNGALCCRSSASWAAP
jgi:hypothetical protein